MALLEGAVTATDQTDDEPKASHLIAKADWHRAYILGEAITALCGKVWVPTRDPERYPLCDACGDIYYRMFGKRP